MFTMLKMSTVEEFRSSLEYSCATCDHFISSGVRNACSSFLCVGRSSNAFIPLIVFNCVCCAGVISARTEKIAAEVSASSAYAIFVKNIWFQKGRGRNSHVAHFLSHWASRRLE